MKYSTFEELPVWKAAIEFALKTFEFTSKGDFRGLGDAKGQLERAALSISNNIAEGFERGTTNELVTFLYISKGSAGETRSMLRLCETSERFLDLRSEISNLITHTTGISKQLNGWINSLINSDIKGVRYLTEAERSKFQRKKDLDEFEQEMESFRRDFAEKLKMGEINKRAAE